MSTITFITEANEKDWVEIVLKSIGKFERNLSGSWVIETDEGPFMVTEDSTAYDGLLSELSSIIGGRMVHPAFFVTRTRCTDLLERFIKSIPRDLNVLIDNDHGVSGPPSLFEELFKTREVDWEYMTEGDFAALIS